MDLLTQKKKQIEIAMYDFKDTCKSEGQNGVISAGIISALKEVFDSKTIELIKNGL